ncbi:MAG: glycerophosphodiester phosphodiesterase family protein [Litoreibacter sp.]
MNQRVRPKKITVFGHRGARGVYPENTMSGFQYLRDIGVDAVEVDVQNAASRVTVVAHDPHIAPALTRDRDGAWVTDASRAILRVEIAELAELDVGTIKSGTDYAARFPDQARLDDERIPTFETFCEWASKDPSLLVNVEIKSHATRSDINDPPEVLAEDIVGLLTKYGLLDRSLVSSFDWRVIHACARLAPELQRGYLTLSRSHGSTMEVNVFEDSLWMDGVRLSDHENSLPQAIADLDGHVWCPYFEDLNEDDLAWAQKCGLRVNVWTVNEAKDIHRMVEMGVDGIISDYPARVQNVLATRTVD